MRKLSFEPSIGMKVKCIDIEYTTQLVVNKLYTIVHIKKLTSTGNTMLGLRGVSNEVIGYYANRFVIPVGVEPPPNIPGIIVYRGVISCQS